MRPKTGRFRLGFAVMLHFKHPGPVAAQDQFFFRGAALIFRRVFRLVYSNAFRDDLSRLGSRLTWRVRQAA